MNLGISDKVALVGASANGIGYACASILAQEGCKVALCDIDEKALEKALDKLQKEVVGCKAVALRADLRKQTDIEQLLIDVKAQLGAIDILVTNAGGPPPGSFDDATDEKWEKAYELTFMSATRLIRGVLPDMKKNGWGRIINLLSRALKEPIPNLMISNSVRAAVAGMAKTLSSEIAHYGITINNVGPGPTKTARAIELAAAKAKKANIPTEEMIERTNKNIPRGRMALPEEQAASVAFLASEQAGHITGVSLLVDGGETKAL